ncbi:MAG: small basic protein [Candidatus Omnitrophica bacterium CG11_big_fil_rev_8_21_14_0_20_42_13]|uniref:Small basic protein n=1 Tax=Candidatus Ghiorseimicrobium undicola TaxID=1974746 RepID=A0A2H0LZZ9_9BACT|nr:MAG: small basic protein [Candidatus Omnitrophica bacterium CG11_big_fil_rev_8_21_14_0_20_42_13]
MSLHPSLVSEGKTKKQRTVLKRIERIKYLMAKELWREGDAIFGLPKIKTVRLKLKKEKIKAAPEGEKAAAGETAAPAGAAKPAAGSKTK